LWADRFGNFGNFGHFSHVGHVVKADKALERLDRLVGRDQVVGAEDRAGCEFVRCVRPGGLPEADLPVLWSDGIAMPV